jgi:hypothetical protein
MRSRLFSRPLARLCLEGYTLQAGTQAQRISAARVARHSRAGHTADARKRGSLPEQSAAKATRRMATTCMSNLLGPAVCSAWLSVDPDAQKLLSELASQTPRQHMCLPCKQIPAQHCGARANGVVAAVAAADPVRHSSVHLQQCKASCSASPHPPRL